MQIRDVAELQALETVESSIQAADSSWSLFC
jgi:hypothetical protein